MSLQQQQATPFEGDSSPASRSLFAVLLRRILPRLEYGRLVVDTPTGERLVFEGRQPGAHAQLRIRRWKSLWRAATGGDIGFAESYLAGEWSSPNLTALMTFMLQNTDASESARRLQVPPILRRLRHALNRNTRRGSRRNISAHYDLGNEFYAHWLDPSMSYSSGLFSGFGQTLEHAQEAKLERVFNLLELSGGEEVLEIGCGWGGLAERMIEKHQCKLTGLTLSARQLEFAHERLRARGLAQYGDLRLQDYRDVQESFDRVVSIEMLEAVGAAYWSTYFKQLRTNLRPNGIAVIQAITIDEQRFDAYRSRPDFIQKYIFPGGMLPTRSIIERQALAAGLELVSIELFGESYARTLSEWQRRFQDAWPDIERLGFDRQFKRTWEYYLAYCQAGFEAAALNVGLYKFRNSAEHA